MGNSKLSVVVLAAGKGTRMKLDMPKALAPALGLGLIDFVLNETEEFLNSINEKSPICVVVGHKKEMIEAHLQKRPSKYSFAWQKEQKGTADALKVAFHDHPELWNTDFIMVSCADTPLVDKKIFEKMWSHLKENPELKAVAASFISKNPHGYGRIVRNAKKIGFKIKEEKDADSEEKKITEVNAAFYIVKTSHLKDVLEKIDNKNNSGEFYLTNIFQEDYLVEALSFDEKYFMGVNTLEQLSEIQEVLLNRKRTMLMQNGVQFILPQTTYIDWLVQINEGTVIYPNVCIEGKTKIGKNCIIESGTVIKKSIIENDVQILSNSYIDSALIHGHTSIGPMARIRPDTEIGENAKIGNFVEIKKSKINKGSKVSHLSYVGDATIGENSNIGCGFITCNYDGKNKHQTIIGNNTFIGSDCQTIAPVEIGDNAFVAAGSTITQNVPSESFAIARAKQVNKDGAAKRFLKSK
jgi:bifunctional UDP-N-acetylglucosamine pyrophosphorylase/glucosamine-1-phosphate N-acetyltransferase